MPSVDILSDQELQTLNELLPWNAFTVDGRGRRLGTPAWSGKRTEPQVIPDPRILLMNDRFNLGKASVLEIGCFEGIHTIALCRMAASVTAVDGRIENVVKTLVRAGLYGVHPTAFICNVESHPLPVNRLESDFIHHVGVLYHLADPVAHVLELGRLARRGLMLDTHVARDEEATLSYSSSGRPWLYRTFTESGLKDPFSGLSAHSKWLRLDDLCGLLREAGFSSLEIAERREERNGLRVLIFASKSPESPP